MNRYLSEILLVLKFLPADYNIRKPMLTTAALFDDLKGIEPTEYWSLSFVPLREIDSSTNSYLCEIWPMMETCPKELFRAGARFKLLLGDKVAGEGLIISQVKSVGATK
jgi:hypothetical protein